ncbi:glutathione S-transferase domain-containing protein [Caballeronia pedi]|uniref:Glutathione-dependent dehydroascorbate reductase n=1 Tax=Caballeronia pedi TaxID=1777141 RepID=A0A158CVI4_9BURK|nr:glutathione S-transferase family protein [Caballeronia pedi]SAK86220.1 glutathione S-transferase domain-containing protein [Caballeronia pedi]
MKLHETSTLTLVSHPLCPYVQRAAIVLAEKGAGFEKRYVDLANRPEWFDALSPLGKVPLLMIARDGHEDAVLFESAVICEYLDETQPGRALLPRDALERARHRGWIEFGSSILAEIWKLEIATDAPTYHAQVKALAQRFATVERVLGAGPWFAGGEFGMVDAVFAPIFRYFEVFDELADLHVFADTPKVTAWRDALAARPSVIGAVPADYAQRLRTFLHSRDAYLLRESTERTI